MLKDVEVFNKTPTKIIQKDVIGEFIFNLRLLNVDRLFGIITGFCDIKHNDSVITLTCKDLATYNEIMKQENFEKLNSSLKNMDSNLNLKIEYNEKETSKIDIKELLKKEFKNILKIKEN